MVYLDGFYLYVKIEIDLRNMFDEENLPAPLAPVIKF